MGAYRLEPEPVVYFGSNFNKALSSIADQHAAFHRQRQRVRRFVIRKRIATSLIKAAFRSAGICASSSRVTFELPLIKIIFQRDGVRKPTIV